MAKPTDTRYPAGYFVERVKRFVLDDERFGATPADRRRLLFEEGLRIRTTVDLRVQQAAEEAVKAVLPNPATDPSGAVVVLDPRTGFVRALVGGRDFFGPEPEAKFDLATQGMRQTGSSFKPIVLAEALAQGIPAQKVYEAPATLTVPMPDGQEPWVVGNYEGEGGPPENLVDATVALRQHRLRPAGPGGGAAEGDRHGPHPRDRRAAQALSLGGAGQQRGQRPRHGVGLLDLRRRRHARRPGVRHRDHPGRRVRPLPAAVDAAPGHPEPRSPGA